MCVVFLSVSSRRDVATAPEVWLARYLLLGEVHLLEMILHNLTSDRVSS